jgi:uncharacterized protein YggE
MADEENRPPSITVKGEGHVRVEPDEAQLWLRLTRLESSSEKALREVAKRSEALQRELDELEVPAADRSMLGVAVNEETEWRKDRKVHKGFRASTVVRLRLTDPDLISRLITRATAEADAEVDGLRWRVSRENEVRRDACRRAAEDARHRAAAYAEGLGVPLGPVERVVETGARAAPRHRAETMDLAYSRSGAPAAAEPEVDVHPGEQEISASVDVTFRLAT